MPTSKAGTWSNASGFTLVELGIVVLLISVFAALTVPMLGNMGEGSMKKTTRRLAGTVRYLYNEAALTGQEHRLVFNLDKNTYTGKRREDNGELVELSGTGKTRELEEDIRIKDIEVPSRGMVSSGEFTVVIYPVGWIDETIIHLEDDKQREMTLRVVPLTGITEVYEGYREF